MSEGQKYAVFYRHFDLPANYTVIALLGDTWISRPEPFHRIHFHNRLEIGFMYEETGLFYIDGETISVRAPCVTLIPQNVPHWEHHQRSRTTGSRRHGAHQRCHTGHHAQSMTTHGVEHR